MVELRQTRKTVIKTHRLKWQRTMSLGSFKVALICNLLVTCCLSYSSTYLIIRTRSRPISDGFKENEPACPLFLFAYLFVCFLLHLLHHMFSNLNSIWQCKPYLANSLAWAAWHLLPPMLSLAAWTYFSGHLSHTPFPFYLSWSKLWHVRQQSLPKRLTRHPWARKLGMCTRRQLWL
jgi:hypothetical protein